MSQYAETWRDRSFLQRQSSGLQSTLSLGSMKKKRKLKGEQKIPVERGQKRGPDYVLLLTMAGMSRTNFSDDCVDCWTAMKVSLSFAGWRSPASTVSVIWLKQAVIDWLDHAAASHAYAALLRLALVVVLRLFRRWQAYACQI